mgnify:CR=1 FL=1
MPTQEERSALENALGLSVTPNAPAENVDDVAQLIEAEISRTPQASKKPDEPRAVARPEPPPAPSPPRGARAKAEPDPGPALPEPAPSEPKVLVARLINSCWTALVRLLTMTDLLVPAPIQARKPLLGWIGIGISALVAVGLAWVACKRL